ncbi:MAG: maleylpyruvate isomerase family mycothiol-dependent enzyme [Acidimicrobiia bacterium]
MLTFDSYLAHFDADAHLLAAAAARGLDPDVPGCPEWTVRDLVIHTADVHCHKADIITGAWIDQSPPHRGLPEGAAPLDWYREEAVRLYKILEKADPALPSYTFGPDKTVGFWYRRMAQETVVHRVDAEQAHGYESAIDPELAVDGVAELFEVFLTRRPVWAQFRPGEDVICIETADQTWAARLGRFVGSRKGVDYADRTMMLEPDAEPQATIGGEPDRVFLWIWGRAPIDDVTVTGDPGVVERFRATCARRLL